MITCHLTTYQALRNRFSAISFHDYLHYCGMFLAHFLMKIDHNIISSLHIVFSLCAQVGWCCLYRFYQCNKSRCRFRCKWDVTIEYLTSATFEKLLTAFHVVTSCVYFLLVNQHYFNISECLDILEMFIYQASFQIKQSPSS